MQIQSWPWKRGTCRRRQGCPKKLPPRLKEEEAGKAATDGVHDTLGEAHLQSLFQPGLEPADQVRVWREAVLAAGAPDNFSLILLRLTSVAAG